MRSRFTESVPGGAVIARLAKSLRHPAYTGKNRCIPCTVVNLGIAAIGSLAIGTALVIGGMDIVVSGVGGLVAFGIAGIVIYFRGYLLPYTPTLTKRYLPDSVLAHFDKLPTDDATPRDVDKPVDVEAFLSQLGILTDCADGDVCLTDRFQSEWTDRMAAVDSISDKRSALAEAFELDDPDRLSVTDFGTNAVALYSNGRRIGQWESRPALLADVAADELLRTDYPAWIELDLAARSTVLNSLRMFLETCPTCGASVHMGEETVESCCRSREVIAVSCDKCDARLFELDLTPEIRSELKSASA